VNYVDHVEEELDFVLNVVPVCASVVKGGEDAWQCFLAVFLKCSAE
jgi:hypothetical protein